MANSINTEVEIKKTISEWAEITIERLQKQIRNKKIGATGSLNNSLIYKLKSLAGTGVSSVNLEFNYYGKFLDMGVGRGQKIEGVKSNRDMYALIGGGRKPKKWFSKTAYGEQIALGKILSNKYGIIGTKIIKESIE
jgi:hypothetical protein